MRMFFGNMCVCVCVIQIGYATICFFLPTFFLFCVTIWRRTQKWRQQNLNKCVQIIIHFFKRWELKGNVSMDKNKSKHARTHTYHYVNKRKKAVRIQEKLHAYEYRNSLAVATFRMHDTNTRQPCVRFDLSCDIRHRFIIKIRFVISFKISIKRISNTASHFVVYRFGLIEFDTPVFDKIAKLKKQQNLCSCEN